MKQHIQCIKCTNTMKPLLTKKGVLIDVCSGCQGVWLDHGEINFFVKESHRLKKYWHFGLDKPHTIEDKCPKCQVPLRQGVLPNFSYQVEECPSCRGIYLDAHEFQNMQKDKLFNKIQKDTSILSSSEDTIPKAYHPYVKLPSFALTTTMVVFSLYGILFGVMVFAMETASLPLWAGSLGFIVIVLLQFYFSPIILDWQLKFLGSLDWVRLDQLPTHFKDSLVKLCQENRIPIPRMGIIRDAAPQAYTYGRTPYSSRVVFSKGMFDLLDKDEVEAVLAHELGHIKHWDFVLMTVIQIVPMVLYNIYVAFRDATDSEDTRDRGGGIACAIVAYIAYLIAEYLVLFASRVREYYADKFSCFATQKPNKLLTALVKISYGLLHSQSTEAKREESSESSQGIPRKEISSTSSSNKSHEKNSDSNLVFGARDPSPDRRSVETLNIMGISGAKQLALAQGTKSEQYSPETIKDIMRWDLWNPWAFYYELHSTHPLTAKRINAISSYALALNQTPYLIFKKQKPESYWDDFLIDFFVLILPYLLGILGVVSYIFLTGQNYTELYTQIFTDIHWNTILGVGSIALLFVCVGALIRTLRTYPGGNFIPCSIAALLKIIKVSPVRSYPILLQGKILGRGDAGWILSEDFFLRDKTGIIFLNHEPFGLNIWFGFFHFKKLQGKDVVVRGWYRRSPTPYIEVKKIQATDYESKAYTYYYKLGFSILGMIVALITLFIIT